MPAKRSNPQKGGPPSKRQASDCGADDNDSDYYSATSSMAERVKQRKSRPKDAGGAAYKPGRDDLSDGSDDESSEDKPTTTPGRPIKAATGAKPLTGAKRRKKAAQGAKVPKSTDPSSDTEPKDPRDDAKELKIADIKRGNIISTYHAEELDGAVKKTNAKTASFLPGQEVLSSKYNYLFCKFRKFLIVAVFQRHFVGLPIYSQKLNSNYRNPHHAEIADYSKLNVHKRKNQVPSGHGQKQGKWLYSIPIIEGHWGRMKEGSVIDLSRPTSFQYNIHGELVSRLHPAEDFLQLENWHKESMNQGRALGAKVSVKLIWCVAPEVEVVESLLARLA